MPSFFTFRRRRVSSSTAKDSIGRPRASRAGSFVHRPRAGLDPGRKLQHQRAEAHGIRRLARALIGLGALGAVAAIEALQAAFLAIFAAERQHHLGEEDVEVAGGREDAGHPSDLGLDRRDLGIDQKAGKDRKRRAQAAEADPHLVERRGIAGAHRPLVAGDLMQAAVRDDAEGVGRGHSHVQRNGDGLDRILGLVLEQAVAARALGFDRKPQGNRFVERPHELEELRRLAALERDLDLGKGVGVLAGVDFVVVDGHFDFGAAAVNDVRGALDARLEDGLQRVADLFVEDRGIGVAVGTDEIRALAGDGFFPLDLVGGVMRRAVGKFDQLHVMAVAVVAQAQRQARLVEGEVVGVVINRGQRVAVGGVLVPLLELVAQTRGGVMGELEFHPQFVGFDRHRPIAAKNRNPQTTPYSVNVFDRNGPFRSSNPSGKFECRACHNQAETRVACELRSHRIFSAQSTVSIRSIGLRKAQGFFRDEVEDHLRAHRGKACNHGFT